jgi:hypothetical protein
MQDAKLIAIRARSLALVAIAASALAGCGGGGSGAETQANPPPPPSPGSTYNGPPPATADVQAFKLNVWDNIQASNRCGSCHSVSGGQSPMFARNDDINLAYQDANLVVTLTSPQDSEMVTKVGGGHNCWIGDNQACATILTQWITNWAGVIATNSGREIVLEAPTLRDPGASRNFPDDNGALFGSTVYPLLAQFCSNCHSSGSAVKQQPFFAEGPASDPDAIEVAYEAAKSKISLDDPATSRLVVRLRDEFHNCWTSSCASDAQDMQNRIAQFAAGVPLTQVDPSLLTSKALTLYEGTIASGGNRYEANVIALYEFKTGQGTTAYDTSGINPAMDLTLSGNVEWFGGWGLNFTGGRAQASTATSAKLRSLITGTGEYSIEAWVAPGNVVQEDSRIVSYSAGTMQRNFNLGQTMYNYDFFNRTNNSDENGNPQLSTPDAAEVLQATLQHVVATFDPVEGRKIYVNGILVADQDTEPGGSLADWDDSYAFMLGNEISADGEGTWMGVIRLVAIHNRVLTPAQILQNFEAGVGEKFFLLFSVSHLTNVPESYVVFEAAIFDTYAYLFKKPFFISLDGTAQPNGIDLEHIRIGINGAEAHVGQSFAKIDTAISATLYDPTTGQVLANLGGVLPLEKGPTLDEFFLTFDRIGANTFARPAAPTPAPPVPVDLPPASDIGVRTYDEISATMATLTGVSQLDAGVVATYAEVRQSMPAIPTLEAYVSSHQAAIAQLAIEYCHALMENPALRSSTFPGFDFNASPATAFANENALFDPLLNRVLGVTQLAHQPDKSAVRTELSRIVNGYPDDPTLPGTVRAGLLNTLPPGQVNDALRTRAIAKAVCSTAVGNAAMLVQ